MIFIFLYYSVRIVELDVDNVELIVELGVDDVEFFFRFGDYGWLVLSWVLLCRAGRSLGFYRRYYWKYLFFR